MAKKKSKPKSPFAGRWRITWMREWDLDDIDEDAERYIEFDPNGMGTFQFGYVYGQMDHRDSTRDGTPCVEWSWEGNDESETVIGRGWAVLEGEELKGWIFIHHGDDLGISVPEGEMNGNPAGLRAGAGLSSSATLIFSWDQALR